MHFLCQGFISLAWLHLDCTFTHRWVPHPYLRTTLYSQPILSNSINSCHRHCGNLKTLCTLRPPPKYINKARDSFMKSSNPNHTQTQRGFNQIPITNLMHLESLQRSSSMIRKTVLGSGIYENLPAGECALLKQKEIAARNSAVTSKANIQWFVCNSDIPLILPPMSIPQHIVQLLNNSCLDRGWIMAHELCHFPE